MPLKMPEIRSFTAENEDGSIFLAYLLCLGLCVSFLLITWKGVEYMQFKIAAQSRADICAVSIATQRMHTLQAMQKTNQVLRATLPAIYLTRGLKIFGGAVAGPLLTLGEVALVRMNHAAAAWQIATLAKNTVMETKNMVCKPTPFSKSLGLCFFRPLYGQLRREKTLFTDLHGALVFSDKDKILLHLKCAVGTSAITKIKITGDPFLRIANMRESYEK